MYVRVYAILVKITLLLPVSWYIKVADSQLVMSIPIAHDCNERTPYAILYINTVTHGWYR